MEEQIPGGDMPLFGREFVAVPDDRKGQIVYKWPDVSLRRYSRAIVDVDEQAVFLNQGQIVGTMGPGQHAIDADELPFLGALVDRVSGGKAYRAELFFVGTREYAGQRFGGRIDDVTDPQTGLVVTLRVFGDYSLRVVDPVKLLTVLTGTVDVADNDSIVGWVSGQLLKAMRSDLTTRIVQHGWPVLGLSAYTSELEQAVTAAAAPVFDSYGLSIVRLGNFDVNLADEDEAALKRLAKDTAYSRMAGGFQQYAQGEALLGAGEGMAKGGSAAGGAILATGVGVGQQALAGQPSTAPAPIAPAQPAPAQPAPPTAQGGGGAPGANHFCSGCGTALPSGARFCPSCGQAVPAAASAAAAPSTGDGPPPPDAAGSGPEEPR
ncbi:MAG TPA: SPFH domain-containing protein [Acidimicrobiales bacterium]|nr:SPFH domain-containing protein [Acidimicrobiales bacterium]